MDGDPSSNNIDSSENPNNQTKET